MSFVILLFVIFTFVTGHPTRGPDRIVGGSETTIQNYPFAAAVLASTDQDVFRQQCGGSIINSRSILTAALCINPNVLSRFRVRLGSSYASRGGMVYSISQAFIHPDFNQLAIFDSDIAVVHTATPIIYIPNLVNSTSIRGPNYVVPDDTPLTAIGWGFTQPNGGASDQLHHVQVFKVNQEICRERWGGMITENMMCAGILDTGGQGQCGHDSGGPLLHDNVIVGVASFTDSYNCVSGVRPNVNVRVSRFTDWIVAMAVS